MGARPPLRESDGSRTPVAISGSKGPSACGSDLSSDTKSAPRRKPCATASSSRSSVKARADCKLGEGDEFPKRFYARRVGGDGVTAGPCAGHGPHVHMSG